MGSAAIACCTPSDPCAAGWDRVQREVAQTDAITDVRARNRVISGSYARLYQSAPELKWAGAAAFASKQVGCGMDMTGAPLGALGQGNKAVYDELYPPLRFYQQNKNTMSNAQIMECMDHKPGEMLHPRIRAGLRQTMAGDGAMGARTMLRHEQEDTLQTMYDESWVLRRGLDAHRWFGYPDIKLTFTAACDGGDALHTVDFDNYSRAGADRFYVFEDRWPFARASADRFTQLAQSPATRQGIDQALDQIARRGGR